MSPLRYSILSNLAFYGFFLVNLGIPVVSFFLRLYIPRISWLLCFIISVLLVFAANQLMFTYVEMPVDQFDESTSTTYDKMGILPSEEGPILLVFGIPFGILDT